MNALTVSLALLATYRVTLLVTSDRITRRPRRWLRDWLYTRAHHDTDPHGPPSRYECSCGWFVHVSEDGHVTTLEPVPPGVQIPVAPFRTPGAAARFVTEATLAHHDDTRHDLGPAGYLLTCPWCISMYLGAAAATLVWAWPEGWWRWPALALAASAATGFLATLAAPDNNDDDDY